MNRFGMRKLGVCLVLLLPYAANDAAAQTRGAVQTSQIKPVYPENLFKTQRQGNAILIGKIDAEGHTKDLRVLLTSVPDFSKPALDAVKLWEFKPAVKDGKPIEVFLNAYLRFRIQSEKHGDVEAPILGGLDVMAADASGTATAPDGFPIQIGKDPALRAEVELDVPSNAASRTLAVRVEAVSPKGKSYPAFQSPVAVPAKANEVKFPTIVKIGDDWEDGVWFLRFTVEGKYAGAGQFWLARDPSHFRFMVPGGL
ncbi:MAG TPA: energy transducer TonB [Thermoanaerobaculia bacterium]|nr:energy transducer TonB [Thermoanaerobaculia bacterium]